MEFDTYYQNNSLEIINEQTALLELAVGLNVYVACGFGDDLDSRVEVVADEPPGYMVACVWPMCAHHEWCSTAEEALHEATAHACECTGRYATG